MKTGQLIKELRIKKGLTQEELAGRTELTARTIQRIENGEVDPRSYTLQMIASALEVDIRVLTEADSEEKEKREMDNERTWLGLIHLSGILLLIFPTIIIWNKQKDIINGISNHFIADHSGIIIFDFCGKALFHYYDIASKWHYFHYECHEGI